MRPHRDACAVCAAILLAAFAAAGAAAEDSFETFALRLGLRGTLRTWQLDRLRHGSDAAKAEAARALARDPALLSADLEPDESARDAVLREVVAALPAADPAVARLRLELARQRIGEAATEVDRLRGDPGDREASERARLALQQAREILAPVLVQGSTRRRSDPRTPAHEGGELLEAWIRTQSAWLARHGFGDARQADLELARATVQFARLVDADADAPRVGNASADLLKTEFGAEAALGLANALEISGKREEAQAWLDALASQVPPTPASARVPATRLALAVDRADADAVQRALERMPPGSLPPSLALAATRVASALPAEQAQLVATRALEAMDGAMRAGWVAQLAAKSGPLQRLAVAVQAAEAGLGLMSEGKLEQPRAAALATELQQALSASGVSVPAGLRADALRLQGWCEHASGDDRAASATFERAAGAGAAVRAESLWMAALCEPATDAAGRARRLDLLRRQRAVDPAGPYAGRVTTWLSRLGGLQGDALPVAVLLEVPASDPFLADARMEAARRLLAVDSPDEQVRRASAHRALQALEPVARQPSVARWRLAAALAADEPDAAAAAARDLPAQDRSDPGVVAGLVRLQVMRGDLAGARAMVEALPADRRGSVALAAADALDRMQGTDHRRAALDLALLALEMQGSTGDVAASRVRLARAVLRAVDEGAEPSPAVAARVVATMADGASDAQSSMALAEALRLCGRPGDAVERMQKMSAGLPQGSAAWAEARWRLFEALRAVDARRAWAMLQQHLALAPDGGPAPWGARFLRAVKEPVP